MYHLLVKVAFNALSTGTMAKMGRVFGNWMVQVLPTNKKLIDRSSRIIASLAKIPYEKAVEEFNRFTNNKTDFIALHQLVYGLGYILMTTTTFNNWNYNSRVKVEEFFGRKMEDVISSIKAYENRPQ